MSTARDASAPNVEQGEAHWLGLRRPWSPRPRVAPGRSDIAPAQVARTRPFVLLAVALSLAALATIAAALSFLTVPE